jgi:NADH-quinone oxidoreductase subunit L
MAASISQNLLLTVPPCRRWSAPSSPASSARPSAASGAHVVTILGVLVASHLPRPCHADGRWLDGARFNATVYEWMPCWAALKMEVGFLIDGLSAMMMVVVTFVSA